MKNKNTGAIQSWQLKCLIAPKNENTQASWPDQSPSGLSMEKVGLDVKIPQNQSQLSTFLHHFDTFLPISRKV